MGAVPRFAQPLRTLAGRPTRQVNADFRAIAHDLGLTLAPIARETGPVTRSDPTYFASAGFDPNARGYALWIPVLCGALDDTVTGSGLGDRAR